MLLRIIIRNVISIFAGLILTVLGLRIVFRVLGLPVASNLVGWIYDLSNQLIMPFERLIAFPVITLSPGRVVETASLAALLFYGLVASFLLRVSRRPPKE